MITIRFVMFTLSALTCDQRTPTGALRPHASRGRERERDQIIQGLGRMPGGTQPGSSQSPNERKKEKSDSTMTVSERIGYVPARERCCGLEFKEGRCDMHISGREGSFETRRWPKKLRQGRD